jgi:hypothetical protein
MIEVTGVSGYFDFGVFYHVRGMAFSPKQIIVVTPAQEMHIPMSGVWERDSDSVEPLPITVDALDFGNLPTGNNRVRMDHIELYDVDRVDLTLDFTLKIMLGSGFEIRWDIKTI